MGNKESPRVTAGLWNIDNTVYTTWWISHGGYRPLDAFVRHMMDGAHALFWSVSVGGWGLLPRRQKCDRVPYLRPVGACTTKHANVKQALAAPPRPGRGCGRYHYMSGVNGNFRRRDGLFGELASVRGERTGTYSDRNAKIFGLDPRSELSDWLLDTNSDVPCSQNSEEKREPFVRVNGASNSFHFLLIKRKRQQLRTNWRLLAGTQRPPAETRQHLVTILLTNIQQDTQQKQHKR